MARGDNLTPFVWQDMNEQPEIQDNGGAAINDPDTQIANSGDHELHLAANIRQVDVRLKYDDGITSVTSPVAQFFGQRPGSSGWEPLYNRSNNHELTFTVTGTNVGDGTYRYTDVTNILPDGCVIMLVGIKIALTGTGTVNNSIIQGLPRI